MKLTKKLNELINSGVTLTKKEAQLVEAYIQSISTPVKSAHLNHYKCLAAVRSGNYNGC